MRIAVAAWVGSTNLGDELVFQSLKNQLIDRGAELTVISVDPSGTQSVHGVKAVGDRDLATLRTLRECDGMVFGGGGLLQDRTSDFNLPYHLSRILCARRNIPIVGVGLGAGPIDTRLGQWLVRRSVPRLTSLSLRDQRSKAVLSELGALPRDGLVAADLAFGLAVPTVASRDQIVVSLRPWVAKRHHLPVGNRQTETSTRFIATAAKSLDDASKRLCLPIRFVALDRKADHDLHLKVANQMATDVTFSRPTLDTVLTEIARSQVVIAMRYHAAVGAILASRPLVTIGYDPKVASLTHEAGPAASALAWSENIPSQRLEKNLLSAMRHQDQISDVLAVLQERQTLNGHVLDRLGL